MAKNNKKKKAQGQGQQFLSPERFIKERARTLPLGKCYINDDADEAGMMSIIVTRQHTGGRISMAGFLVDKLCLGVKDTFYHLRMEDYELEDYLSRYPVYFRECSYEEAHNRIYGAIAFAEEAGIEPHKDFRLTQYMLEEDNDDIPLIEYEYGKDGKHFLVCHSNLEASRYLPTLRKHLGDDFQYLINDQERDDELDEDDFDEDKKWDDDTQPVYIADCIAGLEAEKLHCLAFALGIDIDPNASIEKQREQYVKGVLENPKDVLMRLPSEDLMMLEDLAGESEKDRILIYPNTDADPLMFYYGLIGYDDEDIDSCFYRVAEDFWKAARPHLKEVMNEEANKARLTVEGTILGLVNLYGCVNIKDTKQYMTQLMELPEEAAAELLDIALSHSVLLPYLLSSMTSDTEAIKADYDNNVSFVSRFRWESTAKLLEAMAHHDDKIPARKEYTMEEVIMASSVIPVIPNAHKKDFIRYLCSQLGYDEDRASLICHRLWLRAQHEEDPDDTRGSYFEYFTKEVVSNAPKRLKLTGINEGMQALQAYMNGMPRWILKGHTPEDISR